MSEQESIHNPILDNSVQTEGFTLVQRVPRKRPNGFWKEPQNIEDMAKKHVDAGGLLTDEGLRAKGLSPLRTNANLYYSGGFSAIQEKFDQQSDRKEKGFWEDPANILNEARSAISNGVVFTQKELAKAGLSSLGSAISIYYPGGMRGIRQEIGLDQLRVPRGYWQDEKNIENEAKEFINKGGKLSETALKKGNLSSLAAAIGTNYHGGIKALREKLGEVQELQRPRGYWKDTSRIEEHARLFLQEEGVLTTYLLNQKGKSYLLHAIQKYYPGGMRELQKKVGLEPRYNPVGYWTAETVEDEARKFFEEHGDLTSALMTMEGRTDLVGGIQHNYEGGFTALKEKLGVTTNFVTRGYWTEETIEKEARKFLNEHGDINHVLMRVDGKNGLASAIQRHYRGGMRSLRSKLDMSSHLEIVSQVSPDEADEMMRGLEVLQ